MYQTIIDLQSQHYIDAINELPKNTTGVYYFLDNNHYPLYIGKSLDIKNRIKSHISVASSDGRKQRMLSQTGYISYKPMAGEYGALFYEAAEVKKFLPLYNRQLRQQRHFCSIKISPEKKQVIEYTSEILLDHIEDYYGLFKSRKLAQSHLENLCENSSACKYRCGLSLRKPCFNMQLGKCNYSCENKDSSTITSDIRAALENIRLKQWPYSSAIAFKETFSDSNLPQYIIIDQWHFLGVYDNVDAFKSNNHKNNSIFLDRDYYRLVSQLIYRQRHKDERIIEL